MNKTLFFLLSLALLWGCMDDPFENHSLQLEAEAGVTEAWLSLHVQGLKSGAVYTLQRNGAVIFNSRLQTADTVIYDSLLTPATSYRYRFFAVDRGETSPAAETVLTTLDTTSHDFDWQVYTFGGQKGSSVFYDVAIIDENDIWAVGEIYTEDTYTYDSLGNWIQPYNAAHWNGQKWTLKRIDWDGSVSKLTCVYAFSNDDVWFGVTNLIHWNGIEFVKNWNPVLDEFYDKTVNKIWGTSSSDLYIVGNNGLMAHYDGTGWTKIETGTELDIQDIWGSYNLDEIYIVASTNYKSSLLKYSILNGITELKSFDNLKLMSIWYASSTKLYLCGSSYFNYIPGIAWKKDNNHPDFFLSKTRGTDINNIYVCGTYGYLGYFNGINWKNYYLSASWLRSLAVTDKTVLTVGNLNEKACIVQLKT